MAETSRVSTILFGRSLIKTGQFVGASVVTMVAIYLLLSHTGSLGDGINQWLGTNYILLVWTLLLVALGMITSFSNNGIVVSFIVVSAPLVGYFLSGNMMFATDPTLAKRVLYTTQGMVLYGLPLGLISYCVGRGVRYFRK